jgi:hypothetical protein
MSSQEQDRIKTLLREALPPIEDSAGPARDLWPGLLRRMDAQPAAHSGWLWFDCALAVGLVAMIAVFPASIPVILYYL